MVQVLDRFLTLNKHFAFRQITFISYIPKQKELEFLLFFNFKTSTGNLDCCEILWIALIVTLRGGLPILLALIWQVVLIDFPWFRISWGNMQGFVGDFHRTWWEVSGYPVRASVSLWVCVAGSVCLYVHVCVCVCLCRCVCVCLYFRARVSTIFARPNLVWSPLLASCCLACLDQVCFAQPVCLPGQLLPNPRVSIRFEPARCSPHTLPRPPMMMMDRFWWRRRPSPMNVNRFCCN